MSAGGSIDLVGISFVCLSIDVSLYVLLIASLYEDARRSASLQKCDARISLARLTRPETRSVHLSPLLRQKCPHRRLFQFRHRDRSESYLVRTSRAGSDESSEEARSKYHPALLCRPYYRSHAVLPVPTSRTKVEGPEISPITLIGLVSPAK